MYFGCPFCDREKRLAFGVAVNDNLINQSKSVINFRSFIDFIKNFTKLDHYNHISNLIPNLFYEISHNLFQFSAVTLEFIADDLQSE